MIKYLIDTEKEFVTAKMTGVVSYPELISWHFEIKNRPDYKKHFSGVTDFRNATVLSDPDGMLQIIRFIEEQEITTGRWACLVDKPNETSLATFYEMNTPSSYEMKVFSTEEAASDYLHQEISSMLSELN